MEINAKGFASTSSAGKILDVHFYAIKSKDFDIEFQVDESLIVKKIDLYLTSDDLDSPIGSVEEAYLKLHLISHKVFKPNSLNLDGLFKHLPNVAWTNKGPIAADEINQELLKSKLEGKPLHLVSLDKFPQLTNYIVPRNVRIADTSRVRLGAYLSEGTTVMHEGFVNFNAGTLGSAMIEGRISAGVVVGNNSDLGGGCSTMGTLSGGNNVKISIGESCLLGANSGLGIPLGDNCTIEAGLYITSGSKIELQNEEGDKLDIVKGSDLSYANNILFLRHSINGKIIAKPNKKSIELNNSLHKND
jgi:2,3,4,5-tetrahydropyridine-2-carboxylate N-succinyltransferase